MSVWTLWHSYATHVAWSFIHFFGPKRLILLFPLSLPFVSSKIITAYYIALNTNHMAEALSRIVWNLFVRAEGRRRHCRGKCDVGSGFLGFFFYSGS